MSGENNLLESKSAPLVSVITPFYNTSEYLRECIESILHQSYQNFELILHDNASDDGSTEIALEYARSDSRVRYFRTDTLLGQVENYNTAVSRGSESAKYIKFVQADDWLRPGCLLKMVALAERYPGVGLVSSYYYKGVEIMGEGLEPSQAVVPGSFACELQLRHGFFMFGSPTSVLYRKEAVENREQLYETGKRHEDTELAYEILKLWDFGFVHEILSYLRADETSISGLARDYNPQSLDKFIIVSKFGSYYIQQDLDRFLDRASKKYYSALAYGLCSGNGLSFFKFHREGLRSAGIELNKFQFTRAIAWELLDIPLNPKKSIGRLYRFVKKKFSG